MNNNKNAKQTTQRDSVNTFLAEFNTFLKAETDTEFDYEPAEATPSLLIVFADWQNGTPIAENPLAKDMARAWEE